MLNAAEPEWKLNGVSVILHQALQILFANDSLPPCSLELISRTFLAK
jgi:hypothetical protein